MYEVYIHCKSLRLFSSLFSVWRSYFPPHPFSLVHIHVYSIPVPSFQFPQYVIPMSNSVIIHHGSLLPARMFIPFPIHKKYCVHSIQPNSIPFLCHPASNSLVLNSSLKFCPVKVHTDIDIDILS